MKKKIYRIELKSMEWHIAKDIAVLASFSNGSETKLSLNELANHVKLHNSAVGGTQFTVSVIGNSLLIDRKTENLLHIQEIEVMELEMPQVSAQDARDILDNISGVPTIDSYIGTGISNPNAHENLN